MTGQVFISYSQSDRAYVDKLAALLVNEGIPVWYDYKIETGERFDAVIEKHIDACSAFVVVMTPAAKRSNWVNNELTHASHRHKTVLPLLLDGEAFLILKGQNYEDVRGGAMPSRKFLDHLKHVVVSAKTPDSTELASAAVVRTPVIAVAEPGELVRTINPQAGGLLAVAFSPNSQLLAVGAQQGVSMWSASTGERQEPKPRPGTVARERINSVAWSPDGECLAVGGGYRVGGLRAQGMVWSWHTNSGELRNLRPQKGEVTAVSWSARGKEIASAFSQEGPQGQASSQREWIAQTWDAETAVTHINFPLDSKCRSITFSPSGQRLAISALRTGSASAGATVWSAPSGTHLASIQQSSPVQSVSFSPDGSLLAISGETVRVVRSDDGRLVVDLDSSSSGTRSVVFSPDGQHLATGGVDRYPKLWDLSTGETRFTFGGHPGVVTCVTISPDGRFLATACGDGVARIWRMPE